MVACGSGPLRRSGLERSRRDHRGLFPSDARDAGHDAPLVDGANVPARGVLEVRADMAALISFYEWLTKQKSLRTSLGGFARELARDAGFPRDVASLEALLDYVRARPNSSAQTLAVARAAYRTYERSQESAPRS